MKFKFLLINFTIFSSFIFAQNEWQPQAEGELDNNYRPYAISVPNSETIWSVTWDRTIGNSIPSNHIPKVIKSTDGGATWEIFDVTPAAGRISFDITAFDAQTAYIATQDYGSGAGRSVFKTTDGGVSWSEIYKNVAAGVWLRFFDKNEGIVINRQSMARTTDGGNTWSLIPGNQIAQFRTNESTLITTGNNSCAVNGNHIWFGTDQGRIFRSKDRGKNWNVSNVGLGTNAVLYTVAFKDSLNGITVDGLTGFMSKTTNGGVSWNRFLTVTPFKLATLAYVPGTSGTLIGMGASWATSTGSAISHDFGQTWELISNSEIIGPVQFISPTEGWAANHDSDRTGFDPVFYKFSGDIVPTKNISNSELLRLSPNPVSDFLNIELPKSLASSKGQITLFNAVGSQVSQFDFEGNTTNQLDVSALSSGAYFLKVSTNEGQSISKFFKN